MSYTTELFLARQEKRKTARFDEYLNRTHAKERPMVLDDDMPDDFDNWISNKEVDDIIKYANEAME